jgi:hypothetical protein
MIDESLEVWRTISNYPRYEISNHGRVRSSHRGQIKFLKPWRHEFGYSKVHLFNVDGGKKRYIHQLVLEAFVGEREPGQEVRHLDGNPANNRIENLAWGTRVENQNDKLEHGTHNRGERCGNVKITESAAMEIAKRRAAGEKGRMLAVEFGVSDSIVSKIHHGKSWSWLTGIKRLT